MKTGPHPALSPRERGPPYRHDDSSTHERSLFSSPVRRADRRRPITAREPRSISSRRSSGPRRKAVAEHPERKLVDFGIGENDEMAPESIRAVMTRDQSAGQSWLCRQRCGRVQRGRGAADEAPLWCRDRPGHRGEPLHRLEDGPGHVAGRFHQPRRRHADDRAGLSGGRHRIRNTTAAKSIVCRWWRSTIFCPTWRRFRPTCCGVPSCWCCAIRTARPARWPRATFITG